MPPEILAQYEREFPGLADRLVNWTEQQRSHRQSLERQRTDGSERRMDRSQLIAGTVAVWGITLSALVGIFGSPWAAGVIAVVAIGGPTAAIWLAKTMNGGGKPPSTPTKPSNLPHRT
ncbi:DUF2335 domain-containing protein [Bradyrhizobium sp.]|uniref:DUF2335 domain-containing protein n=1 Tax=Bradyrhizobium sp. TaxID=376 RepID=UPI003C6EC005